MPGEGIHDPLVSGTPGSDRMSHPRGRATICPTSGRQGTANRPARGDARSMGRQASTDRSSPAGADGLRGSSSPYSRILRSSVRVLIPRSSAVRCLLPAVWNRHCWIASCSRSQSVVPRRNRGVSWRGRLTRRGTPAQVAGQEGREQDRARGLQHGLLQDALQLPDVARPGVPAQAIQGLRGDFADVPPQLEAEAPEEVLHEQRQVITAFAQRGQVDA